MKNNAAPAGSVCENPPLCDFETSTGLPAAWLAAILGAAVALFLVWGGPLWSARAGASHLERIGLSYLIVVPLVDGALRWRRAWSGPRLITAVGAIAAVKLVITSALFSLLVAGAERYAPARPWERGAAGHAACEEPRRGGGK